MAPLTESRSTPSSGRTLAWISLLLLFPAAGLAWWLMPFLFAVLATLFLAGAGAFSFLAAAPALPSVTSVVAPAASFGDLELAGVLDQIPDALLAYDKNFKLLFMNPSAERLFGVTRKALLGTVLTPQGVERAETRLLTQVLFPSLAPGMTARSPAGAYPAIADLSFPEPFLELRVATAPLTNAAGMVVGFMKVVRDRTREISLLKSKNEFVTVASHQLRSPLTNIHWALDALDHAEGLDPQSKEIVTGALNATKELLRVIDDLLNIAKIEEGHFGYNFASLNLEEFLDAVVRQAAPAARRTGISVSFERPAAPLPPVTADPQKLTLVLSNLLDNAVRYNVANGRVVVSAKQRPGEPYVEVTIKDTGIGIAKDDLEKLFNKFFRADNAVKYQTEGSGLGLYILRNIIQAHGGRVWAESELERGTTFHFTLATDPTLVPRHEAAIE